MTGPACRSMGSAPTNRSREIQLPRDTEAVVEPAKPGAETVVGDRHQDGPAGGEPAEYLVKLRFAIALDKDRDRGSEREIVLHGAIDAQKHLPIQSEGCLLDGSFRPRLARSVSHDLV